jgi:hypothetical protein
MSLIRRQRPSIRIVLSSAFLYLLLGSACADSGPSAGEAREEAARTQAQAGQERSGEAAGSMERWTRIELVDHYSLKGDVFEDEDLSGIAPLSDKYFLIGADEGRAVQVVELSRQAKTLRVVKSIPLVRSGQEIDIEAIAAEGDWCYITGSHGISKKRGERQDNRFKIFRMKVDPKTHMPADPEVASLWDAISADPVLGEHFLQPLQQRGVNIEGLAVRNGRLFVGFRGPNLGGDAFVMEIPADDLFAGKLRTDNVLHRLHLGEGLGIRDIVAAKTGFLLIAGNSGSEPSEKYTEAENYEEDRDFSMFAWDGKNSEVHRIGSIPETPGKAEAMTILEESATEATVLVLFDGPKGGQPTVYRID